MARPGALLVRAAALDACRQIDAGTAELTYGLGRHSRLAVFRTVEGMLPAVDNRDPSTGS